MSKPVIPNKVASHTSTNDFLRGLWKENPVFVQVLGMCPVLAVTNTAENALAMGLATSFVLLMSNISISIIRRLIPSQVRIVSFILVIATFVTIVDYLIQAISLDVHKGLGAFISLIVVNCLILGRAESFASRNNPWRSALDALGMGIGFSMALLCLGSVRELMGNGSLFGIDLFGARFEKWVVMAMPAGGFFTLAAWLLLFQTFAKRRDSSRTSEGATP